MKLRQLTPATTQLLLLPLFTSLTVAQRSSSVTLAQFQSINGFTASCTSAYNTPIPGCSTADFASNDTPCSVDCVEGLKVITTALNTACKGTLTDPTTLIGLFFEGKGVDALCPSVQSSTRAAPQPTPTDEPEEPEEDPKTSAGEPQATNEPEEPEETDDAGEQEEPEQTETRVTPTVVRTMSMATMTATPSPTDAVPSAGDGNPPPAVASPPPQSTPAAPEPTLATPDSDTPNNDEPGPDVFGGGAIPFSVGDDIVESSQAHLDMDRSKLALALALGATSWVLAAAL